MTSSAKVLIVDDDVRVQSALKRTLGPAGYDVGVAATGEEALTYLREEEADLVLLDLQLPDTDGLALLPRIATYDTNLPVLMMSGAGSIDNAVRSLQRGALDFIEKPLASARVLGSIENALRYKRLARAHPPPAAVVSRPRALLGESAAMRALRDVVRRAAESEARVLIHGEHGTGKELVAHLLHRQSRRAAAPFVTVNCAAIPHELIESELFGHVRGAFTGATSARRGRFELAAGGTLFLDEVGEMPLDMQAKLLRALQESSFERVGSSETVHVDVRVVAATNRNLLHAVEQGRFREDLYYRLAVMPIEVPPLRGRREDVPILSHAFAHEAAAKNHRGSVELSPEALALLAGYDYPGNVRELQNIIERAVILTDGDSVDADVLRRAMPRRAPSAPAAPERVAVESYRAQIERAERHIIQAALARGHGNVAAAARALELERSYLYRKCRALGMPLAKSSRGDKS